MYSCPSQYQVFGSCYFQRHWKKTKIQWGRGLAYRQHRLLTKCAYCSHHLLGAQSMNSRSSREAPPLTSLERIPSNITLKFLSFLSGISARFQLFPWCPVLFHTSLKSFSVCGEKSNVDMVTTSTLISFQRASKWIQSCSCELLSETYTSNFEYNWVTSQRWRRLKWAEINFWPDSETVNTI